MSVVEIDERSRMTIPERLGIKKTKAIVIPAGSYFITIPLSKTPERETERWLPTNKERKELKVEAEKLAEKMRKQRKSRF